MNLEIEVSEGQVETIVKLSGEIDAYTATKLKETLLTLTNQLDKLVIVDLEHVNYMDSTGLGVFVSALKASKENDSHLKLIQIQKRVFRLFKITGLDEIIDVHAIVRGENKNGII
ncbi:STAS domain-containing protein [Virgibacillus soli]|uniref:Anti-sigma factor antagonist n=1 Tax=Paracerasibacillus soli TaxID=480284 RepID=A0ABU5CX79_9BACI|nr:STAS domain-containing protein [Virgibacillus soli]MDY0410457.1 STAS domain-containing protein [Virgibacillus soli]